jgi:hypothetical protein
MRAFGRLAASPSAPARSAASPGSDGELLDIVEAARSELAEGHSRRAFDRLNWGSAARRLPQRQR